MLLLILVAKIDIFPDTPFHACFICFQICVKQKESRFLGGILLLSVCISEFEDEALAGFQLDVLREVDVVASQDVLGLGGLADDLGIAGDVHRRRL